MGTHYNQLTLSERYQIQTYLSLDFSAREIAKKLDRSNKTISREINNCNGRYCAETANRLSLHRRKKAPKNCKLTTDHKHNLEWLLGINLSPEQIAGRMKFEESSNAVSTQTLYRWIDKLGWRERLPRKGKRYRKRAGIEAGARLIPNRVDIDERPLVEQNKELGTGKAIRFMARMDTMSRWLSGYPKYS